MSERACSIGVDFGTESGRVLVLDLDGGAELAVARRPLRARRDRPHAARRRSAAAGRLGAAAPERLDRRDRAGRPGRTRARRDRRRRRSSGSGSTSPHARCCRPSPTARRCASQTGSPAVRTRGRSCGSTTPRSGSPTGSTRSRSQRGEPFLERYGGRISSEWYFPKLIEVWDEDREVYDACDAVPRGDRLDRLVADAVRSCANRRTAGYKAMWSPDEGSAAGRVLRGRYPGFDRPDEKLGSEFVPLGTRAGSLRPSLAGSLGLPESVAVAVGNVDSFVSVPGAGVERPQTFVMVIGTSICDMVVDPVEVRLPGITGVARDGILPGLYGYEAGQAAVGDMLAWFVRTLGGDASSFASLGGGGGHGRAGRQRVGRARLVQRQPHDPRRRRPDRLDPRADAVQHAEPRSTGRCWSRSRSATAGSSTTSPSTGSSSIGSSRAAGSPSAAR